MEKLKVNLSLDGSENEFVEMKKTLYKEHSDVIEQLKAINVSDEIIDKNIAKIFDYAIDKKYCQN